MKKEKLKGKDVKEFEKEKKEIKDKSRARRDRNLTKWNACAMLNA